MKGVDGDPRHSKIILLLQTNMLLDLKRFEVHDLPHGELVYFAQIRRTALFQQGFCLNVRNSCPQLQFNCLRVNRLSSNRMLLRCSEITASNIDRVTFAEEVSQPSSPLLLHLVYSIPYEWNKSTFLLNSNEKNIVVCITPRRACITATIRF